MRHANRNRKFGRERNQRKALLRSLTANLIKHGKIETTEARAKETRRVVERLITQAKSGKLESRRRAIEVIGVLATRTLMNDIAPRYNERRGGYTRIVKLPARKSDGSRQAIIELV